MSKSIKVFACILAAVLLVSVSTRASQMDGSIESSIKNTYVFKVYLKGDTVKISSKNGVVPLEGAVKRFSHILLAQQVSASIPGVKSVDNRLEYYGGFPKLNSDGWISEQLTDSFHDYTNLDDRIQVLVRNGIVTLRGQAYSQTEEETACEYGVR